MTDPSENRIVLDWDGTCVVEVYPGMGDWLPDAVDTIKSFLDEGWDVVIHSTRIAEVGLDEMTTVSNAMEISNIRTMLDEAGLQEVDIWTRSWKPRARYYVDDRGIRFEGKWYDIRRQVERRI